MDKLNNMLSTHITSIQYKDEVEEQAYNAYHAAFLNEAITLDEFKAYAPKSLQGTSADEAVFPEAAFKNAQAKTTFFGSKQKTSYSTKNKYEDTDLGNDGDMWVYNNLEALTQRGKQSPVGIHSPHPPTLFPPLLMCLMCLMTNHTFVVLLTLILLFTGLVTAKWRASGSASKVKKLMTMVNNDRDCTITDLKKYSVHDVIGLLKKWLSHLDKPMIPVTHRCVIVAVHESNRLTVYR